MFLRCEKAQADDTGAVGAILRHCHVDVRCVPFFEKEVKDASGEHNDGTLVATS